MKTSGQENAFTMEETLSREKTGRGQGWEIERSRCSQVLGVALDHAQPVCCLVGGVEKGGEAKGNNFVNKGGKDSRGGVP